MYKYLGRFIAIIAILSLILGIEQSENDNLEISAQTGDIGLNSLSIDGTPRLVANITVNTFGFYDYEICNPNCITGSTLTDGEGQIGVGTYPFRFGGYAPLAANTTYSLRMRLNGTSPWSNRVECTTNFNLTFCGSNPDTDGDGVPDINDACPDQGDQGNGVDTSGCPIVDTDTDGVPDSTDNCVNTPNPGQEDLDNDGDGDACDDDIDGDGFLNGPDQCPTTSGTADINRIGCPDGDNDGYSNDVDNCPEDANTSQEDLDSDGEGDVCDDDIDGDGFLNEPDQCPDTFGTATIDRIGCVDQDSDGYSDDVDFCDATAGTSTIDVFGCPDDDGDGYSNDGDDCPAQLGTSTIDLTGCPDQDDDGYSDTGDNCPSVSNTDQADFDGDGRGDPCDPNISADGACNPDGTAGFIISNGSSEPQFVEWQVINPIDESILAEDDLTILADDVAFVTYGPTTGDTELQVTSADEPASRRLPGCFVPPTATPSPTPGVVSTSPPPPPPPPGPIDVGCVQVDIGDGEDFPQIIYEDDTCGENVELPREEEYQPIQIVLPNTGGVGATINDVYEIPPPGECPDWFLYQSNEASGIDEPRWDIFRTQSQFIPDRFRNLSNNEAATFNLSPSQSPDNRFVVYSTNRDGNFEIYVSSLVDGDDAFQRLTNNSVAASMDPVWSPGNINGFDEGRLVVYESKRREGGWGLFVFDVETGEEEPLTDDSTYNSLNAYWHPEGDRLLFQSDRDGFWQIYELDLRELGDDGFPLQTRLTDGIGDYLDAIYNSDGSQIAVRSNRDGTNFGMYVMDANGDNLTPVSESGIDAQNPVWSPDDNLLAFEARIGADREVFVYDLNNNTLRQVTDNSFEDYAPTWRCGTSNLIFVSEVNGAPDLFETPIDITTDPIVVDPATEADRLTQVTGSPFAETFPQGVPSEENGSREGALPLQVQQ